MHILCRIGLHSWEHNTSVDSMYVRQRTRCRRPGCRYSLWMVVDRARRLR